MALAIDPAHSPRYFIIPYLFTLLIRCEELAYNYSGCKHHSSPVVQFHFAIKNGNDSLHKSHMARGKQCQ